MTVVYSGANIRANTLGLKVRRDAALPPASGASADLFSIDGGQILLVGMVGYITVAIPNESIDFDIDFDPDDGGADRVLATLLAVDAMAAATFLKLNSTTGGALVAHAATVCAGAVLAVPILLDPGDIRLDVAGGGVIGTTARVRWDLLYVPWDSEGVVTAV